MLLSKILKAGGCGIQSDHGSRRKKYGDVLQKDMQVVNVNGASVADQSFQETIKDEKSRRPMKLGFSGGDDNVVACSFDEGPLGLILPRRRRWLCAHKELFCFL